jgi:catechol 2,3-dioxygenase-like lactoylglutathione lyase family enzyme
VNIHLAVVSLWAEDVPACAHFYRDVIGLQVVAHHSGDHPHFKLDGCYLTIQHGQPAFPPAEPRFPVLAISIPVLDQAIEKLRNHGVDLPWGEETNENGRWVMFHDPAGNLVELVEFKK